MKEINIRELKISAPELFNDCWALVAAGDGTAFNMMTISWGALGEMWSRDAAFVFIRPNRYTYEFTEKNELFTISFYDKKYRPQLSLCGSRSGRDIDKVKETGFTPVFTDGTVTFEEADYTIVCRIMASQFIDPAGFRDKSVDSMYDGTDYHKMYIGEIIKVYGK